MKTTPKDFFLHFGAAVALYAAAGTLINLWFTIINYYFPDALAGYFYGNAVAWPISMLVVLVPILYLLEWLINRDIVRMPEKKDLAIRKWRVYLTLFLAIVLVAGDLIALIYTYLNGEITARFAYKILAILLISGTIGKYYFFSLYENFKWSKLARKVNPWFGLILVLAAIVIGFIAVGSPATQRALRFDSQRVSDLENIQSQVVNYWQTKGKLPTKLTDLNDALSYFKLPADPETKQSYEYTTKTGGISFELCATFGRPSRDDAGKGTYYGGTGIAYPMMDMSYPYPGGLDNNWTHEQGRACFSRTIDPDKYPISPRPVNAPTSKGI